MQFDGQLLKWAQTSNGGFTATLSFADEDAAREYFQTKTLAKGKQAGQLFSITFEELDDFGNVPAPTPKRFQGGDIARWLIVTVGNDPLFHEWLNVTNHHAAAQKVKAMLGVESRNQIDGNPVAEKAFHEPIRKPFAAWLEKQKEAA